MTVKNAVSVLSLFGLILMLGCQKDTDIDVPLTFTTSDGSIYIPIDTTNASFLAYSSKPRLKGTMTGLFRDTIRSSFRLALVTKSYWDTIYHPGDTVVFPNHFSSHIKSFTTEIDLTEYSSPFRFFLKGISTEVIWGGPHGRPCITLTFEQE